jgi:hypothetical protein
VFGHQNRSVVLLLKMYGFVAVADSLLVPCTVAPVRPVVVVGLVSSIVAPSSKFVPEIVTDRLGSTQYLTDGGLTPVTVG